MHEQLVGRHLLVVFGVRDRGIEQLEYLVGRAPLAEPQRLARGVDLQAANQPQDLTDLVGRSAQMTECGAGLGHGYRRVDLS